MSSDEIGQLKGAITTLNNTVTQLSQKLDVLIQQMQQRSARIPTPQQQTLEAHPFTLKRAKYVKENLWKLNEGERDHAEAMCKMAVELVEVEIPKNTRDYINNELEVLCATVISGKNHGQYVRKCIEASKAGLTNPGAFLQQHNKRY
jgi:hypothetical protein